MLPFVAFSQDPSQWLCNEHIIISEGKNGLNANLDPGDMFGISVSTIRDINGDGINEILVGNQWDDDQVENSGAIFILFPNRNGEIIKTKKISLTSGNLKANFKSEDQFGYSVTSISDLNNDGVDEIVASVYFDGTHGYRKGSIYIMQIDTGCNVLKTTVIDASHQLLKNELDNDDRLGACAANFGDLNGDGIDDIGVSAHHDDDAGTDAGAFYIFYLDKNGDASSIKKISPNTGKLKGTVKAGDKFGYALCNIGDLDGDGNSEISVGSLLASDGGSNKGALSILFMDANEDVLSVSRISQTSGNLGYTLPVNSGFSRSLAAPGDLDGDSIPDILVGAHRYNESNKTESGAVFAIYLKPNGTAKTAEKITGPNSKYKISPSAGDLFGVGLTAGLDYNNDGITDIVVSAKAQDAGGTDQGALHILCAQKTSTSIRELTRNTELILLSDGVLKFDEIVTEVEIFDMVGKSIYRTKLTTNPLADFTLDSGKPYLIIASSKTGLRETKIISLLK